MPGTLGEVTEQVDSMSNSIFEYGAFTVILAVFLVLFIIVVLYIFFTSQKQMKKLMDDNRAQADEASQQFKLLLNSILEDNEKPIIAGGHTKKDIVKTYIDINLVFKDVCKKVQLNLNADRVGIYVFHNGNKSSHGLPFYKMSCIGEWVIRGQGINTRGKKHVDLPLHVFSAIIESLYNTGNYTNIGKVLGNDELAFKEFITGSNILYLYMLSIYDDDDNLAGFSIAEFKDLPEASIVNKIEDKLTDMNNKIRSIIIDSEIQKKLEEDK